MTEFEMANEPKTKQTRKLIVNLNNISANYFIQLIAKDDQSVIIEGKTETVNLGQAFGPGSADESDTVKTAKATAIQKMEEIVAEYIKATS